MDTHTRSFPEHMRNAEFCLFDTLLLVIHSNTSKMSGADLVPEHGTPSLGKSRVWS